MTGGLLAGAIPARLVLKAPQGKRLPRASQPACGALGLCCGAMYVACKMTSSPPDSPLQVKEIKPALAKGWRHRDAVSLLREMIISGELRPGERLREVAISEKLNMSRTPVREAFRTLAAEGLVKLLPNRSVVVDELDESEAADVFGVLGALESLAAQQASQRMSKAQIDEIGRLQKELERQFEEVDRSRYTETNRRVHELIVEGSGNTSLVMAWRLTLPRAERARTLNNLDRERWAIAVKEHRKIHAALKARDGEKLRNLMLDHFDERIITRLAEDKDAGRDAA